MEASAAGPQASQSRPLREVVAHPAGGSFTLAHLSDPHLTSLDGVQAGQLLSKRLLGYLSWRHKRRHEHPREVVEALMEDLAGEAPDHLVITGDLTHLGTPEECEEAGAWLRTLGPPERVTVVPGNHDTYAEDDWDDTVGRWNAYLRGDRQGNVAPDDFPCLRRRGPLALIGINTARPTAPLLATGRVGTAQIDRLRQMLSRTREEGRCRVVLLHHPVHAEAVSRRKALDDAETVREVLAAEGAELVLHGHGHTEAHRDLPGPGATRIPVFAAPSASALGEHSRQPAGYLSFRISPDGPRCGWNIDVDVRRYDRRRKVFRRADRAHLSVGTSAQAT